MSHIIAILHYIKTAFSLSPQFTLNITSSLIIYISFFLSHVYLNCSTKIRYILLGVPYFYLGFGRKPNGLSWVHASDVRQVLIFTDNNGNSASRRPACFCLQKRQIPVASTIEKVLKHLRFQDFFLLHFSFNFTV